jgi:SPP1 gp7 family putative phage head morphogenesis protein
VIRRLAKRWQSRFDEAADRLAEYFAQDIEKRSTTQLRRILKDGGWSVKFEMTPAMKDIFEATVQQNVALIKSIPQQYLTQVEGMVMRSVQSGRNLKQLTDDLQKRLHVTRDRAELIARDQNNKATSAFTRARQQELGVKRAVWVHSHAGKEPRPTHVHMDGKTYDVTKGMWDPHEQEYIWPGQLINCRCFSRPVIEGLS